MTAMVVVVVYGGSGERGKNAVHNVSKFGREKIENLKVLVFRRFSLYRVRVKIT